MVVALKHAQQALVRLLRLRRDTRVGALQQSFGAGCLERDIRLLGCGPLGRVFGVTANSDLTSGAGAGLGAQNVVPRLVEFIDLIVNAALGLARLSEVRIDGSCARLSNG